MRFPGFRAFYRLFLWSRDTPSVTSQIYFVMFSYNLRHLAAVAMVI